MNMIRLAVDFKSLNFHAEITLTPAAPSSAA